MPTGVMGSRSVDRTLVSSNELKILYLALFLPNAWGCGEDALERRKVRSPSRFRGTVKTRLLRF